MGMPYCAAAASAAAAAAEVEGRDAAECAQKVSSPTHFTCEPSRKGSRTCSAKVALLRLLLRAVQGRVGLVDQGSVRVGADVGERRLVSSGGR